MSPIYQARSGLLVLPSGPAKKGTLLLKDTHKDFSNSLKQLILYAAANLPADKDQAGMTLAEPITAI